MPEQIQQIDIFISSPSDLRSERAVLKKMMESLNDDPAYQGRYLFRPFIYEDEVSEGDLQGMDWQQYINLYRLHPSKAHLVIGMLWSRLGKTLPNFINPITGRPYRSGTEYELSTAYDAQQHHGIPHLLFYQNTRSIVLQQEDNDTYEEAKHQMQLAQDFVRELQDESIIPSPVHTFKDTDDLVLQVSHDLAQILPVIEQHIQA